MRNLTTEEVSVFTYEEWLSRTHGPKRTMICEMAAVVDEEVMVEITSYIVQVKTSDSAGKSFILVKNVLLSLLPIENRECAATCPAAVREGAFSFTIPMKMSTWQLLQTFM